jgi:hypothetical protein
MSDKSRLNKIRQENASREKSSPYNFCDRWCERCPHETQARCQLYLDDLERRVTCLAHGKDEDDQEINEALLEAQCADLETNTPGMTQRMNIDEDATVNLSDLPEEIQKHIRFIQNHPLSRAVEQYQKRARAFLKETFYNNNKSSILPELNDYFEVLSWYHVLLPAKARRALAGFHTPFSEKDLALSDAVAQFEICQKAVTGSQDAIKRIKDHYPVHNQGLIEMRALLHNITSHINSMLESV